MQTVAGWLRRGAAAVLQTGPVPRHVAFIMDGNRRFAERLHLESFRGHSKGYDKLVQALEWCLELGVPCVSVYAFSLENFNRSAAEVDVLMALAEQKLLAILQERSIIERHGVRVQVPGDLSRLPDHVAVAAQRCMAATAHQTHCVLNICLAYTSTQEMWQAVAAVRQQVAAGELATADVSYEMIQQQLYTEGCPPVDLMIRTSGETRLSDFLLPQSGHATLCFSTALWPDFSFLDMLSALTRFQRDAPTLQRNAYAAAQCSSADGRAQIGAQPSAAAAAAAACDNTQRHKTSAAADVTGRRPLEARPAAKAGDGGPTQLMQDRSSSSSSMTLVPVAACKQPAAAGQEPQPAHAATPAAAADRDGLAADAAVIPASLTTCRAASMGKASKRTSLQFDVVAISSAAGPTLIS